MNLTRSLFKSLLLPALLSLSLAQGLPLRAGASETAAQALIQAALQAPERPAEDRERDALRKPAELLQFAGVQSGQQVVDLLPGGGYFTRLFSQMVGSQGKVYALVPAPHDQLSPKFQEILKQGYGKMQTLASSNPNLSALSQELGKLSLPQGLDLVWTSQNYHDIYAYWGPEVMAATNQAIFKALKPGGVYLVIDHVGAAGAVQEVAASLHRIDPQLVKQQVTAAGFVLEAESKALHNPQDQYTVSVFDPKLRGHTDQFVFKFRKPE